VLDEVEERLFAPVDVVEHDGQRPHAAACSSVLRKAHAISSAEAGRRLAEQRADRGCRLRSAAARRAASAPRPRPVRDPLAVGQAAAAATLALQRGSGLGGRAATCRRPRPRRS
jgi:hypothetical protein